MVRKGQHRSEEIPLQIDCQAQPTEVLLLLPSGKIQVTKRVEVYLPAVLIRNVLEEDLLLIQDLNDHIADLQEVINGRQQAQKCNVPRADLQEVLVSENHREALMFSDHQGVLA